MKAVISLRRLHCDMQPADLRSHQSDLSVQLERPEASDLVVTRLGYLHVVLFASDEYLRLYGTPSDVKDLIDYHFVEQVAPQVPSGMVKQVVPNPLAKHFVSVRANTSTAHAYAISRGAGIGLLPTYARAITRRVRPINVDFGLRRDIWLFYHPKVRSVKRVRAAIDWLRDAFDPDRYPWFREEFVPPDKLELDFIHNNGSTSSRDFWSATCDSQSEFLNAADYERSSRLADRSAHSRLPDGSKYEPNRAGQENGRFLPADSKVRKGFEPRRRQPTWPRRSMSA
jgi:hypothetical protein